MNCPRCHLPLRQEKYEDVDIDFCDNCWGCWLDQGELPAIIRAHELQFTDEEKDQILSLEAATNSGPHGQLLCPNCFVFMEQIRYDESIQILVDRCPQHGIWLDAGELKKIQVVAEQTREIQSMIIRKLKLQDSE